MIPAFRLDGQPKTFVLVPGSWHGGWCWSRVVTALTRKRHRVFALTQTGLGERRHLAAAATHIDVYVDDIVNTIECEELHDVVLVGHSFGGIPITGAAARLPARIRSLVYLDAGVPEVGESALSPLSPEEQERRRRSALRLDGIDVLMPPAGAPAHWGIAGAAAEWVMRRLTPHPLATYATPLEYDRSSWEALARTYIRCTAFPHPHLIVRQNQLRADTRWNWIEFPAGHHAMVSHPEELACLLETL
ncbi:alpha/beta fold hydrolase [Paraburkholderia susongensis]|uniref:Alpha/beta hydrolase family protein n=1 Tax=Paraburkholderia susongensis TaxID=1515439 RepID=A0A1X7HXI6_9BURK|nr:alpha/beta fold hydrolase [Paraburkholderia susongensis]SMG06724.1 Alpha/beta hydrolase family protein [Paraburkholderia susongensis]